MFLFPFEDVHTRNHESFPINFRSSPVTIDDTSHLAATLVQEVPAYSGNFLWYMIDSIAVLEDSYSEVVVNAIDLVLNWQLFSNVGRPRSFVNVKQYFRSCINCFGSKARKLVGMLHRRFSSWTDTNTLRCPLNYHQEIVGACLPFRLSEFLVL